MSYLDQYFFLFAQSDEFVGFVQFLCYGFFDKNMFAGLDEILGDLIMQACRNNNADGVDIFYHIMEIQITFDAVSFSSFQSDMFPGIANTYKFHAFKFFSQKSIHFSVKSSQVSSSNNAYFNLFSIHSMCLF